ncbi:uncharacterized protein LOC105227075 isoform X2 [Bactrocera dorsalis]|uniref:Uncharacterized protein LOC105227075 isoform X2 n=2 Tax=Bactrocera dorsalis TaxID=27457 RepID=A0ABM3K413_BACDO|nr:uncharacterized protein LOC105227075 isoform X2 [Bactrocera dorsalis]
MNMGIVGKAGPVKSNGKRHINHTLKSLHEINDIFPTEDFFSKTSCHKCINNADTLHTPYINRSTNKSREEKIFRNFKSSTITGNNTILGIKKANKSISRRGLASSIAITSKLDSGNGFKKSLQRQSKKKVTTFATSTLLTTNLIVDSIRDIGAEKADDIASSKLHINKPLQAGSHHKVKCRTAKLHRIQSRVIQTTAGDTETVPANAEASIKLPNKSLICGKISLWSMLASESAMKQISGSLTKTALTPTSTWRAAFALSTLAQTLLDLSVIPQAWQQFVKLLRNSVLGLNTSSRAVTTSLSMAKKSTRVVSQLDKTSTATGAVGTATAAERCKAAATFISSLHPSGSSLRTKFRLLPSVGATSFFTLLTLICLETVLLSTVSNCAKTFYMHWNTSNSIFRIDNTDHIIDVNKGNLAFEFDQVHIICPVYEPGTFENETEKYIIYNVSKVEYETCRITNATPRVIAICDKPQKLMFFTITFRPFTPQPGGLEFLPGNDYYFISTSSKDDLYRRIGGRCSTNNMKVVFKVCCAPEEKNKTLINTGSSSSSSSSGSTSAGGTIIGINTADGNGLTTGIDNAASMDVASAQTNTNQHQHMSNINTIGINGVNTGLIPIGGVHIGVNSAVGVSNSGMQMKSMNGGSGTSINTNIDQFNRIPIQAGGINVMGNNVGGLGGIGLGGHGGGGIMLAPGGQGGINMISSGVGIGIGQYPGHSGQTGIRINNVASQQHHATHKNNNNDDHYEKHPNEVVKNEELTYNSGAASMKPWSFWTTISTATSWLVFNIYKWLLKRSKTTEGILFLSRFSSNCEYGERSRTAAQLQSEYIQIITKVLQLYLQCFVKLKYLVFNYYVLIISINVIVAATIYGLQFDIQNTTMKDKTPQLKFYSATCGSKSCSAVKFVIASHFTLAIFNPKVNRKFLFMYLAGSVKPLRCYSAGFIFLLDDICTSPNSFTPVTISAFSSKYFLIVRRRADQIALNTGMQQNLSLSLIKNSHSQIFSVSVKVKKFR